jgi:transposase
MGSHARQPYPREVSDDEWAFVAPYLTLRREDAPQRDHPWREVFNGLRWLVRTGAEWRLMPHDRPPWYTVNQQGRRWVAAAVFEDIVHDLRRLLREVEGRARTDSGGVGQPHAPIESREWGTRWL